MKNLLGMVQIGGNQVGIVYKRFGSQLPNGKHIAINGEAGYQADILPPGTYFGYLPWEYEIRKKPVINIPQGEIGLVVAKDGATIPSRRILGRVVECNDFQDAKAFLTNGGEKGEQLGILKPGTYRINTELFTVITVDNSRSHGLNPEDLKVYQVAPDHIGIVKTKDGQTITTDDIAGKKIYGHDSFQNPQEFIDRGGYKGLQEEFINSGSWNLNPWFVTVKQVPLKYVPPGTVGVIISYVGHNSQNLGNELVEKGYKGIQKQTLPNGKYAI
ncbi:MAG: flotillin family protein, partial [Sphaerospermopsis sp. SIO1G2]|nr:flotillin family protein [Sphaerospermopsis sp. SIO1G2]